MVIKLDVRKILHGRPRMVTRDLFAVANLVPDFTQKTRWVRAAEFRYSHRHHYGRRLQLTSRFLVVTEASIVLRVLGETAVKIFSFMKKMIRLLALKTFSAVTLTFLTSSCYCTLLKYDLHNAVFHKVV